MVGKWNELLCLNLKKMELPLHEVGGTDLKGNCGGMRDVCERQDAIILL